VKDKSRVLIKFNDYKTTKKGKPPKYTLRFQIDNKSTLGDVKEKISKMISLESD